MNTWVAEDGSWGMCEVVKINLKDYEVAIFADLTESEQWAVAKALVENRDDPDFDFHSALAANDL